MLEGSILQQLRDAHHTGQLGKRRLNFGVYYKNTLVALCHALEDCILTSNSSPVVITAFQRGKWYLQEAERYGDLAQASRQVVIMAAPDTGFAEHPTSQRSNVALVGLDRDDPVAQEWHLIIFSPTYTAMVLCQELSSADYGPAGPPADDRERKFYGFWTFEPGLVQETVELAIAHLGRYQPQLQQQLIAQVKELTATPPTNHPDILTKVVPCVVDYLQDSEQDLTQNAQTLIQNSAYQTFLDSNLISNELQAFLRLAQLIDQADISNPMAAAEVAAIAEMMGQLLDLPTWQLNRLRLAGLLHRLAYLQNVDNMLSPSSVRYQEESPSSPLTCPLIPGTQVLRTMPRLRAIATIITHQTEWWNGQGKPAGLAGDEIPLESRILGLVADFQQRLNRLATNQHESSTPESNLTAALMGCQVQQGDRWDPKLVDTLALLVSGLQQGLNISISLPKIAAGMWLLDSYAGEQVPEPPNQTQSETSGIYVAETYGS